MSRASEVQSFSAELLQQQPLCRKGLPWSVSAGPGWPGSQEGTA